MHKLLAFFLSIGANDSHQTTFERFFQPIEKKIAPKRCCVFRRTILADKDKLPLLIGEEKVL
jgi:hypothetical protein